MKKFKIGISQIKFNKIKNEDGTITYEVGNMSLVFDLIYKCGARIISISHPLDNFYITCELIYPNKYKNFVGKFLEDFPYDKFQLEHLQ